MMEKGRSPILSSWVRHFVRKILEVCREIPEKERRRFQTAREADRQMSGLAVVMSLRGSRILLFKQSV